MALGYGAVHYENDRCYSVFAVEVAGETLSPDYAEFDKTVSIDVAQYSRYRYNTASH